MFSFFFVIGSVSCTSSRLSSRSKISQNILHRRCYRWERKLACIWSRINKWLRTIETKSDLSSETNR